MVNYLNKSSSSPKQKSAIVFINLLGLEQKINTLHIWFFFFCCRVYAVQVVNIYQDGMFYL